MKYDLTKVGSIVYRVPICTRKPKNAVMSEKAFPGLDDHMTIREIVFEMSAYRSMVRYMTELKIDVKVPELHDSVSIADELMYRASESNEAKDAMIQQILSSLDHLKANLMATFSNAVDRAIENAIVPEIQKAIGGLKIEQKPDSPYSAKYESVPVTFIDEVTGDVYAGVLGEDALKYLQDLTNSQPLTLEKMEELYYKILGEQVEGNITFKKSTEA